jgi:hypothetical protein
MRAEAREVDGVPEILPQLDCTYKLLSSEQLAESAKKLANFEEQTKQSILNIQEARRLRLDSKR